MDIPRITSLRDHQGDIGISAWVLMNLRAARLVELADALEANPDPVEGVAVPAIADQGRWIVQCPSCPGGSMVDLDDLRFFCRSCYNERFDGRWLRVVLPLKRRQIEAVIRGRPKQWRSWTPEKAIRDLLTENVLHEAW